MNGNAPRNLQWMSPRGERTATAVALRAFTLLVEPFYTVATVLRNRAYDLGLLRTHRLHLPVVSVGNITTGGTGKTPMVVHVAELLKAGGRRPAVLLRGYKSTVALGSDEQRLLAEALPGVPVIANPDRRAAARALRRDHPEVDVVILDDGFQHRRIARDFDMVLVDATNPFGFDHVLPRGLLRETAGGIRRASAIAVTHADAVSAAELATLTTRLGRLSAAPVSVFSHVWGPVLDQADKTVTLRGGGPGKPRVLAFCGIGNPQPFFETAARHTTLADRRVFPDHFAYTAADLESLLQRAVELDAVALLTTQKDWVKLRSRVKSAPFDRPIWRPQLRLEPGDDQREAADGLDRLILEATRKAPQ